MILTSNNRDIAKQLVETADDGMVMEIRKPKRSLDSNRYLWAVLGDISEQVVIGKPYEPSIWHVYFKQLFLPDLVQELPDGSLNVAPPSSAKLTQKEFSDYVEKVVQWALEHDVKFSEDTRRLGDER
jgi:hypothetical protein